VDRAGGIHSLARRIDGIKAAELRTYMAGIDRNALPDAAPAKAQIEEAERLAREARDEKAYGRGGDYATQSGVALEDHQRRQARLDGKIDRERADRLKRMFDRIDREEREGKDDRDPDRQKEAPGGGRSRSR
jgi:hypothetical protein